MKAPRHIIAAASVFLMGLALGAAPAIQTDVSPKLHVGERLSATITYTRQGMLGSPPQAETSQMSAQVLGVQNGLAHIQLTLKEPKGEMSGSYDYDIAANQLLQNDHPVPSRNSVVGMFYNPSIWGPLPADIHVGQSWTVRTSMDDYTPAGTMKVVVQEVDRSAGRIVLVRNGSGTGATGVTSQMKVSTQSGSTSSTTAVTSGRTTWNGRIELIHGVAVRNEFFSSTQIRLPASAGVDQRDTVFNYSAVLVGRTSN